MLRIIIIILSIIGYTNFNIVFVNSLTGEFVKFVNSKNEAQVAPPDSMTSTKARSNLHCASVCALSAHCHGYNFRIVSGVCEMNMASALPVISDMKKLYD